MSRRWIGWALVIGFGVLNGYVTFKPAFEGRELEKLRREEVAAADLGSDMIEITNQSGDQPHERLSDRAAAMKGKISATR